MGSTYSLTIGGVVTNLSDSIAELQTIGEAFPQAVISKEYNQRFLPVAKWTGTRWEYTNYTAKQKAGGRIVKKKARRR